MGATLLIASIGGHLVELDRWARRLEIGGSQAHPQVWVTNRGEQSVSLTAGRTVEFVPYVRARNITDIADCLPDARRLMARWRPERVISTGSAIALGYVPYLAAKGVECHYVESVTRVAGPSMTGRVLHALPSVWTYTQYHSWAGSGWRYAGCLLDDYAPVPTQAGSRSSGVVRVVVTVGLASEFPFRRLLEHLVPLLAPRGPFAAATGAKVEVTWLTGETPTDGLPITPTGVLPAAVLARELATADVVICHAGAGSVLDALEAGRRPVVVVRESARGEQRDSHQDELAAELGRRGLAIGRTVTTISTRDLLAALGSAVVRRASAGRYDLDYRLRGMCNVGYRDGNTDSDVSA